MALLLLLGLLTVCAATPRDLSGKMFTFPQETNTAHVRLTASRQDLRAVTVCFRSFTELQRDHSLFSLATPSAANDFLIFKSAADGVIHVGAKQNGADISGQHYELNAWVSICSTWDAASGLVQVWIDGKPSSRIFVSSGSNINGPIIIVLGQEQDSHGGDFDVNQSFIGMMSDVHMWDYVVSPHEIQNYAHRFVGFTPGNVLNWRELEFQTVGRVLIEDEQWSIT
ncbi:C-reactive protein-like isoform X2 [Acanthopagrus latus]|nr:C-reactive protein-like isoform X2 [Acanthopagrus latus]XP_036930111.1 C-reactive protein-like isoform X2 [Acanthopagrus latus]